VEAAGTAIFGEREEVHAAMALRVGVKQVYKQRATNSDEIGKGVIYAAGNDRSGKDGGEHGSAARQRRTPVFRFRHVAKSSERVSPGEGGRELLTA
jgi:hypothetical protein